jgi:hypothetical protein
MLIQEFLEVLMLHSVFKFYLCKNLKNEQTDN